MAGLVWNFPTSCAWAARVYVSNKEARDHGIRSVGLPSRTASFSATAPPAGQDAAPSSAVADRPRPRAPFARAKAAARPAKAPPAGPTWWEATDPAGPGPASSSSVVLIRSEDGASGGARAVCGLALPPAPPPRAWAGPRLTLALPSFSGGTPACPALLQYACALATHVRPLRPARVLWPPGSEASAGGGGGGAPPDLECLHRLLRGRPLVALAFEDMTMTVQEPVRVATGDKAGGRGRSSRRRAALLT
jgi:hypothetical protein